MGRNRKEFKRSTKDSKMYNILPLQENHSVWMHLPNDVLSDYDDINGYVELYSSTMSMSIDGHVDDNYYPNYMVQDFYLNQI